MKKKLLALLLACVMIAGLAACAGGDSNTGSSDNPDETTPVSADPGGASTETPAGDGAKYTVGISQFVTHDALDAATKGFMDALNDIFGEGVVKFDYQNAAEDPATCSTIANAFVSAKVDLIMANATPALQAAAAATAEIPILATSITEYGVALSIDNFTGTVGGNISGTSDLAPLDRQAAMIKEWCPEAKTVGLLYCANEPNSQYQVDTVQKYLEDMDFICTQYSFSDSNDIAAVCQTAADNSDVLYVPTDNAVASNTGIVDNICRGKVPVFAGEEAICAGCGVATLTISYYDLGYATGEMAAKVLTGEADISTLPIGYAANFTPKYNPTICEALGLTAVEGYEAIG